MPVNTKTFSPSELRVTVIGDDNELAYITEYQEEILRLAQDAKASDLAQYFTWLRQLHDQLDDLTKELGKVVDSLKTHFIPTTFEAEDLTSLKTTDGHTVSLETRVFASIKEGMKESAFEWLRDKGYGDSIVETVHAQRLTSIAKEVLTGEAEGVFDMPEEVFTVTPRRQARFTKGRKS
jgi:transcriptional accessory protein Tex/SPT6